MKIVTIHDIVSDWKKTFNFTDQEFSDLKLGKVKTLVNQERPECLSELQRYVFNGNFLTDDDLAVCILTTTQAITLQYLFLPKSNMNFKIDPISTAAANEWSKQNPPSSSSVNLDRQVFDRVAQSLTVPIVTAPAAPAEVPIKWFNLAVLVRTVLTCAVYLYTGRGEITFEAKIRTTLAGVILYLLHIGALKMLFKLVFHSVMEKYFRLDRNNEYIDANPVPVAPNGVPPVMGGPAAPQARRLAPEDHISRRIQGAIDAALTILKEGITVPKAPGVVNDVLAVFIGLVGSLFPRWTADGAALIEFN